MNITTLTLSRKKNLGNYETADFSISAELSENDNVDQAAEDLAFYLDFKLNQSERERKLEQMKGDIDEGKLSEEAINQRKDWVAKYEEAAKRFNSLEFIK